jgi:pimeloyl-ACP methyl ester carboxylesterase
MLRDAVRNWLPVLDTAEEEMLVPDVAGRLAEIHCPTLVAVGAEDVDGTVTDPGSAVGDAGSGDGDPKRGRERLPRPCEP